MSFSIDNLEIGIADLVNSITEDAKSLRHVRSLTRVMPGGFV
jgi:hypothetical protein